MKQAFHACVASAVGLFLVSLAFFIKALWSSPHYYRIRLGDTGGILIIVACIAAVAAMVINDLREK